MKQLCPKKHIHSYLDDDMYFDHLLKENNKRAQRQNRIVCLNIRTLITITNAEFKQKF